MAASTSFNIGRPLVYAHLGDLHITDAKARNYLDLLAMLAQLEVAGKGQLDFMYLPGDVADNGRAERYRLVAAALRLASVPVYSISGDHDMEPGSLAAFYAGLGAPSLPLAVEVRGVRCLFLDVCGSDFRLGAPQLAWLGKQLSQVPAGAEVALVMHTYPTDLRDATGRFGRHRIELARGPYQHLGPLGAGSDAASIGAWEENGTLGTQLGPNRNAKPLHHLSSSSS